MPDFSKRAKTEIKQTLAPLYREAQEKLWALTRQVYKGHPSEEVEQRDVERINNAYYTMEGILKATLALGIRREELFDAVAAADEKKKKEVVQYE